MTKDVGASSGSRASMEPSCTVSTLTGFDPARLTEPQRVALERMLRFGSNPYGWAASDLIATGRTMQSLWEKGFVHGGNVYGARTRTYILSDEGRAVAIAMEARRAETTEIGSVHDSAAIAQKEGRND